MSSYGIIVPASRRYIIVNGKPGEDVGEIIVLEPSPTQSAMINDSGEDVLSVMSDGGPAYETLSMEFTADHGSVATARFVDGSPLMDDQLLTLVASNILLLQTLRADHGLWDQEQIIDSAIGGNEEEEEEDEEEEDYEGDDDDDDEDDVEDDDYFVVVYEEEGGGGEGEEEMCVICQAEYEAEEMIATLECGHGYHPKCIRKWLRKKKVCPICRFTGFSSLEEEED